MVCTEGQLEAARRYRARHPERARAAGRDSERRRRAKGIRSGRAWELLHPEKVLASNHRTKCKKHGLTVEQFAEMLLQQNNVCALCGCGEPRVGCKLSIDHNHACCPGKYSCGKCVRGLLCSNCNTALGLFDDNPELMLKARDYIAMHPIPQAGR